MREAFETRMMELMLDYSIVDPRDNEEFLVEPWRAIECMRHALNEFEATIYQP